MFFVNAAARTVSLLCVAQAGYLLWVGADITLYAVDDLSMASVLKCCNLLLTCHVLVRARQQGDNGLQNVSVRPVKVGAIIVCGQGFASIDIKV